MKNLKEQFIIIAIIAIIAIVFNACTDSIAHNLTKRELEIMSLIKNGFTNQQIADKLFLSIYTIETHRKNIMHKLFLNTPAALMKFIIENNL